MTHYKKLLTNAIKLLPRRIEYSGGKKHSYIKLDDILALLNSDMGGNEERPLVENYDTKVKYCFVCGLPQFETPSGITCDNGHGGADSVDSPLKAQGVFTISVNDGFCEYSYKLKIPYKDSLSISDVIKGICKNFGIKVPESTLRWSILKEL